MCFLFLVVRLDEMEFEYVPNNGAVKNGRVTEVTGHYIGVKENGKSNDVIETPYVRMTFGSSDEAKQYYESKTNEEGEHWIVKWNQQMCEGVSTKWACVASQTPASYKVLLDGLRELGKKISEIIPDKVVEKDVSSESSAPCDSGDDRSSLQPILDPNVSQTKGRNKDDGARGNMLTLRMEWIQSPRILNNSLKREKNKGAYSLEEQSLSFFALLLEGIRFKNRLDHFTIDMTPPSLCSFTTLNRSCMISYRLPLFAAPPIFQKVPTVDENILSQNHHFPGLRWSYLGYIGSGISQLTLRDEVDSITKDIKCNSSSRRKTKMLIISRMFDFWLNYHPSIRSGYWLKEALICKPDLKLLLAQPSSSDLNNHSPPSVLPTFDGIGKGVPSPRKWRGSASTLTNMGHLSSVISSPKAHSGQSSSDLNNRSTSAVLPTRGHWRIYSHSPLQPRVLKDKGKSIVRDLAPTPMYTTVTYLVWSSSPGTPLEKTKFYAKKMLWNLAVVILNRVIVDNHTFTNLRSRLKDVRKRWTFNEPAMKKE
ncbi:hypothetical protein IFM89_020446 [Coptis chinensis]|uniref:Uncharacterized protein n=1 Tax=Coptis chinensis TaxID=261450 RepID=A0A835H471_9MAGN|nr:hypothetical protein IFM89_020446 [Coptis chinensis]